MVDWTDGNSSLQVDKGPFRCTVPWRLEPFQAHLYLSQLKCDGTVSVTSKNARTLGILVLLEGKVLGPRQSNLRQKLSQNLQGWSLVQSYILIAVPFFPQINHFNIPCLDGCHQSFMHIVINLSKVNVWLYRTCWIKSFSSADPFLYFFTCSCIRRSLAVNKFAQLCCIHVHRWEQTCLQNMLDIYHII